MPHPETKLARRSSRTAVPHCVYPDMLSYASWASAPCEAEGCDALLRPEDLLCFQCARGGRSYCHLLAASHGAPATASAAPVSDRHSHHYEACFRTAVVLPLARAMALFLRGLRPILCHSVDVPTC